MRALLHVHSSFSYDGESSLEDLATWGARRGLDAIFLSEHVNDFDGSKMARLVAECAALRGQGADLVPGLEFSVRGGFHVLGFHLKSFRAETDPASAVQFIRDQNGIAVLAHPSRYRGSWPEPNVLSCMDGVEVWNARYDGRFCPPGTVLADFAERCREGALLRPYGGHDLHATTPQGLIVTDVPHARSTNDMLEQLRLGRASFGGNTLRISMASCPDAGMIRLASGGHRLYRFARALRNRLSGARSAPPAEEI